jgi:hypothetical protein
MFQVYVLNVSSISDVCGNVFYLNVAKVDLDAAYICKCFKSFHTYVAGFHPDVLHMFVMATRVFKFFLVLRKCFRYML